MFLKLRNILCVSDGDFDFSAGDIVTPLDGDKTVFMSESLYTVYMYYILCSVVLSLSLS